jgi:DNA recombination protein RmuC
MLVVVVALLVLIVVGLAVTLAFVLRHRPPPPIDVAGLLAPGWKSVGDGLERTERALRNDVAVSARDLRAEVGGQLQALQQALRTGQSELMTTQQQSSTTTSKALLGELARFGAQLQGGTTQTREQLNRMIEALTRFGGELSASQRQQATEMLGKLLAAQHELGAAQRKDAVDSATRLTTTLQAMTTKLEAATTAQREQGALLQDRVVRALGALQESNEKKLDQMRVVVDEKLQGTLETRIGEAFKMVSERLEQVHRGLGEMQTLASGVGDLKKVLSNVKNRGTWGEMQLGLLLQNMLAPTQYAANVAVRPDSSERVEYAVRMPGHCDDVVWLPIDAKFPLSAWQRLVEASERGDVDGVALAEKQFEAEVLRCAHDITTKYVAPPHTADYAILFAPTESLYAEIARRPVLLERLVSDHHVVVAGPVTLSAILSAIQMAFRTTTIQKRTDDIAQLLAIVKAEMGNFEKLFTKLRKKLQEASNHLDNLDTRRRAVGRALRAVEAAPDTLPELDAVDDAGDGESAAADGA